MDQTQIALLRYTELLGLKKIEAEFWNSLEKKLSENNHYEQVNLKPLIKLHKSVNMAMMKMITTPPQAPVEAEGFTQIIE